MEYWIRTCQECDNEQVTKPPDTSKELTESYRNARCRKCKSEALDYGSNRSDLDPDTRDQQDWIKEIT